MNAGWSVVEAMSRCSARNKCVPVVPRVARRPGVAIRRVTAVRLKWTAVVLQTTTDKPTYTPRTHTHHTYQSGS